MWLKRFSTGFCLSTGLLLFGCRKVEPEQLPMCTHQRVDYFTNEVEGALFPIARENFWVYTDSIWTHDTFSFDTLLTSLLFIEDYLKVENQYTVLSFNHQTQFSNEYMVHGDTLSVYWNRLPSETGVCYTTTPRFFPTNDTVIFRADDGYGNQEILFRDPRPLQTPAGLFTQNLTYSYGGFIEFTLNEAVGVVEMRLFNLDSLGNLRPRRKLTLKDYRHF